MRLAHCLVCGLGFACLLGTLPVYVVACVTSFDNTCLPKDEDAIYVPQIGPPQVPFISQRAADELQLQMVVDQERAERELLERERIQHKEQALANIISSCPTYEDFQRYSSFLRSGPFSPAALAQWREAAVAQAYADIDADINEQLATSWDIVLSAQQEFASRYAVGK
jgi:hypothetical protein